MEGLTDSIYRRLHHKYFPGVDKYYMPFLSPTIHRQLTHKEDRELPLADSVPFAAVPQVLTKVSEDFLWAAQVCRDRGYDEVNLNVGCPSGTVVSKGKGSGMLRSPDALDRFLDEIFHASPLPITVKTRLGLENPEEFPALLEVFNRYPIKELTIHPRVRKQFYDGSVHMELFDYAVQNSRNPLCYNGDILTLSQAEAISQKYPQVHSVMIGRGLIADPGMLSGGTTVQALEGFMEEMMAVYEVAFGGSRNAIFRLKENWGFLHDRFEGCDKLWKRLRKSTDAAEFKSITAEIFHTLPLK
ncbi:MAG: tRNA-dihydrouridine synthase family protein [Oscillospiraceae bacterium]|nr:tRNA-dihydrouridine synthase family protein [Oscillospiraceae bacterium]MBQ3193360.1 tRNA-dihydrouridine synthase family protein [Oscillospiraceae bacterium]